MITAQVESFAEHLDELKTILPTHHAELALFKDKMPLDPQFDLYIARERAGELLFVTLREDAALVGYWISFIAPGLHYRSTLTATMDILYVHPDHRGNGGGFKLADVVKAELVRRGVKVWWAGSKNHKEIAWFLERLGMAKAEEYFVMWLGD
jgi:GNAT superfamily N-acetyltransferase